MQLRKYLNVIIALQLLLMFNKSTGVDGYNINQLEFDSIFEDIIEKLVILKDNIGQVNSDLDALHSKLHLHSDVVNAIRTKIFHEDKNDDQCVNGDLFNEIDTKLNKMKQNLVKIINDNDDKHLEKLDAILHNVKVARTCEAETNPEQINELKIQIGRKLQKLDYYNERLEILENKLQNKTKTNKNKSDKLLNLDNLISAINLKLSKQEKNLLEFGEHFSDMKNVSSIVENHLTRKRKMSRCQRGKCMLYRLIEIDKALNITRID